jgi:hypothetical protein
VRLRGSRAGRRQAGEGSRNELERAHRGVQRSRKA